MRTSETSIIVDLQFPLQAYFLWHCVESRLGNIWYVLQFERFSEPHICALFLMSSNLFIDVFKNRAIRENECFKPLRVPHGP
jgi:hypothetical protein